MSIKKMVALAGGAALGYVASKKLLKQDFCPKCAVNKVISATKVQPLERRTYYITIVCRVPPWGLAQCWVHCTHPIMEFLQWP